jgi:parallel beta-helix repeat protein
MVELLEGRVVPSTFVPGSIQGQDGWSGGSGAISPSVDQAVVQTGSDTHLGVGAWHISNDTSNGNYNGAFGGWVFSPGLSVAAGDPSSGAGADRFSATFFFRSASTVADGSNIEVDLGNTAGSDRTTFLAITNEADGNGGLQLRMAEPNPADPGNDYFYPTQIVTTGISRGVWHRIDIRATFVDGASNDTFEVSLDGTPMTNSTPGSPNNGTSNWGTFEGYDAAHGYAYQESNRLLFRSGAAPSGYGSFSDTGAQGFYFDDVSYKDWNSSAPGTILASYATTFEPVAPPSTVYVNASWAGLPVGVDPDGAGPAAGIGYDAFATIQDGLNAVASGGTVYVAAGTYSENVLVNKPVTLLGANAGLAGSSGSRTAESGVRTNGNQTAIFTVAASGVTIDGFLLEGDDPSVTGSALASGVDSNALYGVHTSTPVSNLTVEDSIVRDVFVGVRGDGPTSGSAVSGSLVTNDWFDSIGNFDFGYAVSLRTNFYADVTNNLMTHVWSGLHTNNFYLPGPTTWTMSGNEVHSYAGGLLYWLQYQAATGLTVSNNQFFAETGAVANNFGMLLVSIQDSVKPTFTNNTITGTDYGVGLTNVSTSNTITLDSSNSIVGTKKAGVYLTDNLTFNPVNTTDLTTNSYTGPNSAIAVVLDGLSIQPASGDGILVEAARTSASDVSTTATIGSGVSISGGTTGLVVSGAAASIAGHTLNDMTFTGQSGQYIDLTQGALAGSTLDATGVTFDGHTGATATLAQNFAIEDKISDYLDAGTLGYVKLNAGQVYVAHSSELANAGAVQRGVNAALAGDVVNLQAGTYVANGHYTVSGSTVGATGGQEVAELNIDKPLTLLGPNATYDPNSGLVPANDQAIIIPGASDPNPYDPNAVIVMLISSSNVTVQGITVDGINPNLTHYADPGTASGYTGYVTAIHNSAAPIDAAELIASYAKVGNVTLQNDILQNAGYNAVDFKNSTDYTPGATTGSVISKNLIQSVSDAYRYGDGVSLNNDFYADVTENVIQNVRTGVQVGNYHLANPNADPTQFANVSNNTISADKIGLWYNLFYQSSSPFTFANNTISALPLATNSKWSGVYIHSVQDSSSGTFQGNTIDGSNAYPLVPSDGYDVWDTSTTGQLLISGGSVTGVDYGVWVNTYEGYSSPAHNTQVTVSGLDITASQIGVWVEASPKNTTGATATATIDNNTSITTSGGGIGVKVSGATASATISGNHIYDNTTGTEFTGGGKGSVSGNDFSFGSSTPAMNNGTDLLIDSTAGAVSIGDGNAFAASTDYLQNLSSQKFDLSGYTTTTFGGFNAATTAVTSANQGTFFGIEDKIVDYLDNPSDGYLRLKSGHEFITQLSETTTAGAIQRGINVASSSDTVNVDAGTYNELVTIDKSVTLDGVQYGVDARTRTGPETLVSNSEGDFQIEADNVTIDGFTLTGATANPNSDPAALGAAIWSNPGFSGTHGGHQIVNNIITGNIAGIELDNDGTFQALVQHNLFKDNTEVGPADGTDIVVDFGLSNAMIDSNAFTNTAFVESAYALGVEAGSDHITFSNNTVDNHGRGVYFYDTNTASITNNTITGASHYAIGLFGNNGSPANSLFTISNNTLDANGSGGTGVELVNDTSASAYSGTLMLANFGLLVTDVKQEFVNVAPGMIHYGDTKVLYSDVHQVNLNNTTAVNAMPGPDTADRDAAFAGLSADERFVQALYLGTLGRAGSNAEVDAWLPVLGAAGQQAVVADIASSLEARDRLVKTWYQLYLGRAADGTEEMGWVSKLDAGQSEEMVLSQILGSTEFYARAQTMGFKGTADQNYVQALFQVLLNRTASDAEVAGWSSTLPQLGTQGVALGFLQSQEFRTYQFEAYYNALLGRPDDPIGLTGWVQSPNDMGSVRIGFESGTEFFTNG